MPPDRKQLRVSRVYWLARGWPNHELVPTPKAAPQQRGRHRPLSYRAPRRRAVITVAISSGRGLMKSRRTRPSGSGLTVNTPVSTTLHLVQTEMMGNRQTGMIGNTGS